jgi:CrcB protein
MWLTYASVAMGGLVGSMVREGVTSLFELTKLDTDWFPIPTLIVNLIGAFVLGFLSELLSKNGRWYYGLCTGFCGGLTTFSSFCNQIEAMIKNNGLNEASVYGIVSVSGGIVLAFVGTLFHRPAKKITDGMGPTGTADWGREQLISAYIDLSGPYTAVTSLIDQ